MEVDAQKSDHDLLILLNQAVKDLREEVRRMADNISVTVGDHETRIRSLESFKWLIIGALILLQAFGDVIIYFVLHK